MNARRLEVVRAYDAERSRALRRVWLDGFAYGVAAAGLVALALWFMRP